MEEKLRGVKSHHVAYFVRLIQRYGRDILGMDSMHMEEGIKVLESG